MAVTEVWVGQDYEASEKRILILGESWYAQLESLSEYIPKWAAKKIRDNTFSRIFNASSGFHTSKAKEQEILRFWNSIAFYNFVVGTVGESRKHRPTKVQYEISRTSLQSVLEVLKPKGVWILGRGQAEYSMPIVSAMGLKHEVVAHPTSYGLKAVVLKDSWLSLQESIV